MGIFSLNHFGISALEDRLGGARGLRGSAFQAPALLAKVPGLAFRV